MSIAAESAESGRHGASYRDPAGFVFRHGGEIFRAVAEEYAPHYRHLTDSGLYSVLVKRHGIIEHSEVSPPAGWEGAWKVLQPRRLPVWSYPYEWSFAQLQAAALHTLQLLKTGLAHGMVLKDASAYNIQFHEGRPLLADSLSFELYEEGNSWKAFRQFCEHFLYPLILMSRLRDAGPSLFLAHPDGIPARMVTEVLPGAYRLRLDYALYVYLPAAVGGKASSDKRELKIGSKKILQNAERLGAFIRRLKPAAARTVWNHYYEETILSNEYLCHKEAVLENLLARIRPRRVTDLGCNTGAFSVIAARYAAEVIALDGDAGSIDALYRTIRREGPRNIFPLVADIVYPSPAAGWMNGAQDPLLVRVIADCVLALALVHHLALSRNLPLQMIAECFAAITLDWLLAEYVPKTDPRASLLLATKGDIFPGYTQHGFEQAFGAWFMIEERITLAGSERVLYVMRKRAAA